MEEIYWGIIISLLGALLSLVKDWKSKDKDGHFRSNVIAIIGLALVISGSVKSCSFTRNF